MASAVVRASETTSSFSELPCLGVGLGFREPLLSDLFRHRRDVDFLEIVADHYLDAPPAKLRELELLADHFPVIPHAINLSLGSADGIDHEYLAKLARLIERLRPPWWSEHIAYTRAGGVDVGHLCPLPRTGEAIEAFCGNVAEVRSRIDVPLLLENVTCVVELPGAELSEAEFVSEIIRRTGCGLLLDVANLHTNAINHGYDPYRALDELPLEKAVQLHFAGGHTSDGILVDSHASPTPPEVWRLLEAVVERAPVKGIILERDQNLPPLAELTAELEHARSIGRRCGRWA